MGQQQDTAAPQRQGRPADDTRSACQRTLGDVPRLHSPPRGHRIIPVLFQSCPGAPGCSPWTNPYAVTGPNGFDPAHDSRGNMTTVPRPAGPDQTYACTYDAWNRLVKVQTDAETPATVAEYRYDGLHRRTAKLLPNGENWDRTDYYHTRSWQVIEERFADAQANKDTPAADAKYQYVWSLRYIDACILRDQDKDSDGDCTDDEGTGSERLYYTNGANMEVTALLNTSGNVVERYLYTPYGQPTIYDEDWSDTVTWEDSKKNEILFAGYRYEPETTGYQVRYREYWARLGRWGQTDPLGYADSMDRYEYARANSVRWIDPMGTAPRPPDGTYQNDGGLDLYPPGTRGYPYPSPPPTKQAPDPWHLVHEGQIVTSGDWEFSWVSSVSHREPGGTYQAVEEFEEDNKPKCRIRQFPAYVSMETHICQWQRDSYITDAQVYVQDAFWRRAFANAEDAMNVADLFTWDPISEGITSAAEIATIIARKIAEASGAKFYEVKVVTGATVTERVSKEGPAMKVREVKGWDSDCVGPGDVVGEGECGEMYPRASAHNDRQREEAMEKYPEGVVE